MTAGALRTPLALLVEALWSFAAAALFVLFFAQGDGPGPSIASVGAVVLLSFVVARLVQSTTDDEGDMRALGVAVSVAVLLVIAQLTYSDAPWGFGWARDVLSHPNAAIQPNGHVISGVAALTALWVRGVQRGSLPELDFEDALSSISVGLALVMVAALATPDVMGDVSWGALAFAYGIVALLTLAAFNTQQTAPLSSFAGRWPLVIGALAAIALAAALVAGTIDRDVFSPLATLTSPLEPAGRALRDYVLAPIIWVIALPIRAFVWFLNLFAPENNDEPRLVPQEPVENPPADEEEPLWFRILLAAGSALGAIVVGAIVLAVLWYAFRRYIRRRRDDPNETREDIEPAAAAPRGSMFGAIGRRFRGGGRESTSVAVRKLYFEMLDVARERGLERPPWATPLQFAGALDANFGSSVGSEISAAFVESRYGEREVADDRVRELRLRLQSAG